MIFTHCFVGHHEHRLDNAAGWRTDDMFHFHGIHNEQLLTLINLITFFDINLDDRALKRRGNSGCARRNVSGYVRQRCRCCRFLLLNKSCGMIPCFSEFEQVIINIARVNGI